MLVPRRLVQNEKINLDFKQSPPIAGLRTRNKLPRVGGFNPSKEYQSNWIISPKIEVNIKLT